MSQLQLAVPITRIRPSHGWVPLRLAELWDYRELLYFLTWRDVKVRYRQTLLGAAWALIQPVCTMLVFSLFFGQLARVPSDGVPYPIFRWFLPPFGRPELSAQSHWEQVSTAGRTTAPSGR